MDWFLVVLLSSCYGIGGDPGIVPGACHSQEVRLQMPSHDVCEEVKTINGAAVGECWAREARKEGRLPPDVLMKWATQNDLVLRDVSPITMPPSKTPFEMRFEPQK